MTANFNKHIIEFHILQSFPVSCLNRDDVGAPKTAIVGGVTRARVSSQAWKRQVRLTMGELGVKLGKRTKVAHSLFAEACRRAGAGDSAADACGLKMSEMLADDTLLFISNAEADAFALYAKEFGFDAEKLKVKELAKVAKGALTPATDGFDIALFGRMVAKATDMNVEAAASFSHAISTHQVSNEVEFFTALDDLATEPGSAHMGSLEYNSATYYRYISLSLGELEEHVGREGLGDAISAFTKALYLAIPGARQATQSAASPWEFARVLVRKGQRLQAPFEMPVKSTGDGYLKPSIQELKSYLHKKEKITGSLFGKIASYDIGESEEYSIDDLIADLKKQVQ